jgi:hypothetical protein
MVGIGYAGGNSLGIIRKDITRIEHMAILTLLAGGSLSHVRLLQVQAL